MSRAILQFASLEINIKKCYNPCPDITVARARRRKREFRLRLRD
jgi:hypothetical protein